MPGNELQRWNVATYIKKKHSEGGREQCHTEDLKETSNRSF